ncbi:MAG: DoxX family protein [Nocardioides sp.]
MTPIRLLARPMLASMFVVGGINALKNPEGPAAAAEPVTERIMPLAERVLPASLPIPRNPQTLVRINGAAQLAAALALATGRAPRLAATVLAASLVPTTAAGHRFWEETDPAARAGQRVHFFKNVSMLGGLLLAGVDTEGKPGVAWRARRLAHDAKREAALAKAKLS